MGLLRKSNDVAVEWLIEGGRGLRSGEEEEEAGDRVLTDILLVWDGDGGWQVVRVGHRSTS